MIEEQWPLSPENQELLKTVIAKMDGFRQETNRKLEQELSQGANTDTDVPLEDQSEWGAPSGSTTA